MADKTLGFKIVIDGVSNEAMELAKITNQIANLNKEYKDLQKTIKDQGGMASNDQIAKLAAYRKELDNQKQSQKELTKVLDSAPDSLNRMRAELIRLKGEYANTSAEVREKMAPAINKLNTEISNAEQAIGVHQRNVGNYPQLFSMIPGPVGQAASAIQSFSTKLAAIGPIGAAIGAGIALISAPVIGFLKWTQEGMDLLAVKTSQFNSAIRVLKGELADIGKKEIAEASKSGGILSFLGSIWDLYKKIELGGIKIIVPDIGKHIEDTAEKMKEAAAAAKIYTEKIHEIEQEEISEIVQRAKATEKIRAARLAYQEGNGTIIERLALFDKALILENQTTAQEIKHAQERADAIHDFNIEKAKTIPLTREEQRIEQEAFAKLFELQSASEQRLIKFAGLRKKLQKEVIDGTAEEIAERKRQVEEEKKSEEEEVKNLNEFHAVKQSLYDEWDKNYKKEQEDKWNFDLEIGRKNFAAQKRAAKDEMKIIDDKIKWEDAEEERQSRYELRVYEETQQSKYKIAQSASNLIGAIAGKSKDLQKAALVAEKALAIAEIIIQTKRANMILRANAEASTLPGPGYIGRVILNELRIQPAITFNNIAAALNIAAIVAAVAQGLAGFSKGGKISRGVPIYTDTRDDTLIAVNKTETVLTQRQVAMLGGSGVMRKIHVPGYQDGGYVGQQVPEIPTPNADLRELINRLGVLEVRLDINKLNKAENELSVITISQRI